MVYSLRTLVAVMTVLLLSVVEVQADLIPWMYHWSRSPHQLHADAPGTGYITLTDEPLRHAVGDSDIVATNLKTYSSATLTNKDIFTNKSYSLTLTLIDGPSSESGSLTFTGYLDGWVTAQSSYLRNTFTGQLTQVIVLGTNVYTVTIDGYTPPGIPGSVNSGSISAKASVRVEALVSQVPEPATLTLAGVGLSLLLAARSRAGRQRER